MEESVKKKKRFAGIWVYVPCLLVAVIIWLAVMKAKPPTVTAEWRDVPVTVVGAEMLQDAGYDPVFSTVVRRVVLKGTREALYRCLNECDVTVCADLSSVAPGETSASVSAKVFGLPEGVTVAEPVSVVFTFNKR